MCGTAERSRIRRSRSVEPAAEPTSDPPAFSQAGASDLGALLEGYERSLILAALGAVGGRQRSAAELLRILPSTLDEKMKRLGVRAQRAAPRIVAPLNAQSSASLHWSGRVPPGGVLEIRGLNGPVRVEATGDERVEVLAARRGPSALLVALRAPAPRRLQLRPSNPAKRPAQELPSTAGLLASSLAEDYLWAFSTQPPGLGGRTTQ